MPRHFRGVPVERSSGRRFGRHRSLECGAWALGETIRLWQANPEPALVVFNVNVPNFPTARLARTLLAAPAHDSCLTKYRFSPDPHLENTLVVHHEAGDDLAPEPWTDAWAVALGYVAIPDLLCVMPWSVPSEASRCRCSQCLSGPYLA